MRFINSKIKYLRGRFYRFSINVEDNNKTLNKILKHKLSVARFGDGEFEIIRGNSIPYQNYDSKLAIRMKRIILNGSNADLLICLPDVFRKMDRYNFNCQKFYYENFFYQNKKMLSEIEKKGKKYGSTFLSRPYIDLKNKNKSANYFKKLKYLWNKKDLLIVEGKYTRSGEGNDLFANANSICRIICPSQNAFNYVDKIENSIEKYRKNKLILLMLGPTAKIIVDDLYKKISNQLIDIGHIDSEYEWFKMGATYKIKIPHKHTAEFNFDDESVKLAKDSAFNKQIVDIISSNNDL